MPTRLGVEVNLYGPGASVVAGEPLFIAGTTGEVVALGVPLDVLLVVVGEVHEVTADGGAAADNLVGDGLLAGLDRTEEVADVVGTLVDAFLGVLEEFALGLDIGGGDGAVGVVLATGVLGEDLAFADEFEASPVDLHLPFGAEEVDAKAVGVLDGDAVGVLQDDAAFVALVVGGVNFDGAAAVHPKSPLGDIKVVCAPVGDHATAELHVVAPAWKVVVHASWGEHGVVGTHRRGADPEVPVQSRFRLLLLEVARASGVPEGAFDALNLADDAVADEIDGGSKLAAGALHGAGLKDAAMLVHSVDDFDGFVDVVREGLFAVHVFAVAQCGEHGDGVPVVGSGDADRVDVLAAGDFTEVVVAFAILVLVAVVDALDGVIAPSGVDIAHGEHLGILAEEVAQEASTLLAHADEAHGDPVVGAPCGGWDDEGRGHGGGGTFEKGTAVLFHGAV